MGDAATLAVEAVVGNNDLKVPYVGAALVTVRQFIGGQPDDLKEVTNSSHRNRGRLHLDSGIPSRSVADTGSDADVRGYVGPRNGAVALYVVDDGGVDVDPHIAVGRGRDIRTSRGLVESQWPSVRTQAISHNTDGHALCDSSVAGYPLHISVRIERDEIATKDRRDVVAGNSVVDDMEVSSTTESAGRDKASGISDVRHLIASLVDEGAYAPILIDPWATAVCRDPRVPAALDKSCCRLSSNALARCCVFPAW